MTIGLETFINHPQLQLVLKKKRQKRALQTLEKLYPK